MKAYERFLEYVKVYTTSDPDSETHPSSRRQFDLAHQLVAEMKAIGIGDARVDEFCIVYGGIPATPGHENAPAIGLLAHMDTAYEAAGENVRPLLHPNYGGGDVHLPGGRVIDVKTFPELKRLAGKTLITASGDTLLGADDKAGVAEIVTACEALLRGGVPHGRVCVAFTPDEEVGRGTDKFDVGAFGADFAYTVDGGPVDEVEYETFNAAQATVTFTGVEVHPGSAKGIMVNALRLAAEFDALLPENERPERTDGYEGYYHLMKLDGGVGKAVAKYIIREHADDKCEHRKQVMLDAAAELNRRYGATRAEVVLKDEYRNMACVVKENFHLIENARRAIEQAGLTPVTKPVRGGTDGCKLSFMGLPCPNLGTGGLYFHGPNECIAAEDMDKAVEILLNILRLYA